MERGSLSDFDGDIMQITVHDGLEAVTFYVHKTRLTKESKFFDAMANFKEGEENHVTLEGIEHTTFRHILHLLYRGTLDQNLDQHRSALMKVWAVADRLMMTQYHHTINVALKDCCEVTSPTGPNGPTADDFKTVMDLGYGADSRLMEFLMDEYINSTYDARREEKLKEDLYENLPPDVVFDILWHIVEKMREVVVNKPRRYFHRGR